MLAISFDFNWPVFVVEIGSWFKEIFFFDASGVVAPECSVSEASPAVIVMMKFALKNALLPMAGFVFGTLWLASKLMGICTTNLKSKAHFHEMALHCINAVIAAHSILIMVLAKSCFSLVGTSTSAETGVVRLTNFPTVDNDEHPKT